MQRRFLLAALVAAAVGGWAVWLRAEPVPSTSTDHWSLRPLVRPAIPPARNEPNFPVRTPIDNFILEKLLEQKLTHSAPADKRTLIRRVTFDLTGLPPTPEEVTNFIADASPNAYEKVVDRLLASPAYGERWARHWLDVVHYGESHGFGMDRPRDHAWPYRDYVIKSFNDDKPYARFAQEQLAGDVLFPDDPQATIALGFIACGPWNQSGLAEQTDNTACKRQAQNLDRDDMLMNTMSTFVSTTVHCARCHDHKFDPVKQREYYALQSCFAAMDKAERPYDADPKLHALRQKLMKEKFALETGVLPMGVAMPAAPSDGEIDAFEQSLANNEGKWHVVAPSAAYADSGFSGKPQSDGSVLFDNATGPERDNYTLIVHTPLRNITAVRLETLTDPSMPANGPGRAIDGNFALSEFRIAVGSDRDETPLEPAPFKRVTADFDETGWRVDGAIDGNESTAWGVHPQEGRAHVAVFELKDPIAGFNDGEASSSSSSSASATTIRVRMVQNSPGRHLIGRPRISVTNDANVGTVRVLPAAVTDALRVPPPQRSAEQKSALVAYVQKMRVVDALEALPAPSMVYAGTNDFPSFHNFHASPMPRPVAVLRRGEIDKVVEPATPGALACIAGLPARFELTNGNDEGARRAALAKWVTDPRNVLTWRSIVNRVWQYHFGRGIVDTPSDFGRMGGRPSHPELLDWLAVWFRDDAHGSIKALHKLIVTSSVYMQSSDHNAEFAKRDGGDVFLWRMNRTRLDAECVRDAILQITNRLDRTMGGPSVKQSVFSDTDANLTPKADYGNFDVDSKESRRRSVYRFILRTVPDPFMESMDCPDASQLTAKRNVSVTPLQALAMLNNRFVVKYAEHLAETVAGAGGETSKQLSRAYELTLNRKPTPEELSELGDYAKQFGMSNACRVILNSNEFLFVD